jgi:hypothetical protein
MLAAVGVMLAAVLAAPLTIDLVVHGRATAERGGVVTLRGTVQCSVSTIVTLEGVVVQSFRRGDSVVGTFATEVPCDITPTPWTVTVTSENGVPFRPGFASADVRVVGFDPESGVFTGVESFVLLHLTRSPR